MAEFVSELTLTATSTPVLADLEPLTMVAPTRESSLLKFVNLIEQLNSILEFAVTTAHPPSPQLKLPPCAVWNSIIHSSYFALIFIIYFICNRCFGRQQWTCRCFRFHPLLQPVVDVSLRLPEHPARRLRRNGTQLVLRSWEKLINCFRFSNPIDSTVWWQLLWTVSERFAHKQNVYKYLLSFFFTFFSSDRYIRHSIRIRQHCWYHL